MMKGTSQFQESSFPKQEQARRKASHKERKGNRVVDPSEAAGRDGAKPDLDSISGETVRGPWTRPLEKQKSIHAYASAVTG